MNPSYEEMITAKPTRLGRFCWNLFSKISTQLVFRSIVVEPTLALNPQRSILLVGNHISWWDGFWALRLNQLHFRRHYYVMMLESQLKHMRFMRQGGAFSIDPGHRSVITSIQYTVQLLQNPQNLVVMYPQGIIHSLYENEIRFQPGVCKILDRVGEATDVIFYAAHIDFMEYSRPYLHIRLNRYSYLKGAHIKEFNDAYQLFFDQAIAEHKQLNRV